MPGFPNLLGHAEECSLFCISSKISWRCDKAGQAARGSEQPVPGEGSAQGTSWPLKYVATQTILWFYENCGAGLAHDEQLVSF